MLASAEHMHSPGGSCCQGTPATEARTWHRKLLRLTHVVGRVTLPALWHSHIQVPQSSALTHLRGTSTRWSDVGCLAQIRVSDTMHKADVALQQRGAGKAGAVIATEPTKQASSGPGLPLGGPQAGQCHLLFHQGGCQSEHKFVRHLAHSLRLCQESPCGVSSQRARAMAHSRHWQMSLAGPYPGGALNPQYLPH